MQSSKSYVKDSDDFIRKIRDIQYIPSNAVLADVIVLHPSIPHHSGLKSLKNILDKRKKQNKLTAYLIKMSEE